jgi:hypothetical protein
MNAGRGLSEVDDRRGGGTAGPVAVLSYKAANRLFGTPAASIGGTITLERIPFTVVGVTGRGFNGLNVGSDVDLVVPLETEPMLNRIPPRTTRWPWLHVTGRLAPGMTLDGTIAAMRAASLGSARPRCLTSAAPKIATTICASRGRCDRRRPEVHVCGAAISRRL